MKNLNLIRKIAWNFHRSTGIDFDELLQEAAFAYIIHLPDWKPSRGRISTFMWVSITDHLKRYRIDLKKHELDRFNIIKHDKITEQNLIINQLSPEAFKIAQIILKTPKPYITMTPDRAKKRIVHILKQQGWDLRHIWIGLHDLTLAFN